MRTEKEEGLRVGLIVKAVLLILVCVVVLVEMSSIFDTNNAGEIVIKQAAVTGEMSAITDPGMFWQLWGSLHSYKRAGTIYFDSPDKCKDFQASDKDALCTSPIPVRHAYPVFAIWPDPWDPLVWHEAGGRNERVGRSVGYRGKGGAVDRRIAASGVGGVSHG